MKRDCTTGRGLWQMEESVVEEEDLWYRKKTCGREGTGLQKGKGETTVVEGGMGGCSKGSENVMENGRGCG